MEEKIDKKTRIKEWVFVIGAIVVVTVTSIIAYNYGLSSTNKNEYAKEETVKEEQNNSKDMYLSSNDINVIKDKFPNFDYYLENILENAGFNSTEINQTIDYITNNLSENNLLDNENFKFSFAFHIGNLLYASKYTGSNQETGLYEINVSDFEEIYKNLYAEEYSFDEVPVNTKFTLSNNKIVGSIYTGFESNLYFELNVEDTILNAKIYDFDRENNQKGSKYYGQMSLVLEKNDNNFYSIDKLILNK